MFDWVLNTLLDLSKIMKIYVGYAQSGNSDPLEDLRWSF